MIQKKSYKELESNIHIRVKNESKFDKFKKMYTNFLINLIVIDFGTLFAAII